MKKTILFLLVVFSFAFVSCDTVFNLASSVVEEAVKGNTESVSTTFLKDKVYERALYYTTCNTAYHSGSTGRSNAIYFDCSGFVIRCYEDAVKGSGLTLPFKGHPTANDLMTTYSLKTERPERGDLIFLNFDRDGSTRANHVGIFVGYEGNKIKFIDASNYSGYSKVVDFRKITKGDEAILGYGVMKIGS